MWKKILIIVIALFGLRVLVMISGVYVTIPYADSLIRSVVNIFLGLAGRVLGATVETWHL